MADEDLSLKSNQEEEYVIKRDKTQEEPDYTQVRFLRVILRNEIKTVEIITEQNRSAQLRSKNDFV